MIFHVKYSFRRHLDCVAWDSRTTRDPHPTPNQSYAAARMFRLDNEMLNSGVKVMTHNLYGNNTFWRQCGGTQVDII
jgi:hypothetical protein